MMAKDHTARSARFLMDTRHFMGMKLVIASLLSNTKIDEIRRHARLWILRTFDTPLKKGSHYELYGVQNIPNRGGTVCHRSSSSACDLVPCAQAAGEVGVNVTS